MPGVSLWQALSAKYFYVWIFPSFQVNPERLAEVLHGLWRQYAVIGFYTQLLQLSAVLLQPTAEST